jgi:hypothetical protein
MEQSGQLRTSATRWSHQTLRRLDAILMLHYGDPPARRIQHDAPDQRGTVSDDGSWSFARLAARESQDVKARTVRRSIRKKECDLEATYEADR